MTGRARACPPLAAARIPPDLLAIYAVFVLAIYAVFVCRIVEESLHPVSRADREAAY